MLIILLSLIFLFHSFSFANIKSFYCIQLYTSKSKEKSIKYYEFVRNLPDARIEKVGKYYILRVGFFQKKDEAIKILKKVKKIFKDALLRKCYYIPKRIIYPKGKVKEKYFSKDEELYNLMISAFLGAKKLKEAEKVLKIAISKYPNNPYWWEMYARVLIWNGKPEKALDVYLKAFKRFKSKEFAQKALNLALSFRKYNIAAELMKYLKLPLRVKQVIYENLGEIEKLIIVLDKLGTEEALFEEAYILFNLGENDKALKVLEKLEKRYGLNEKVVLLKADIFYAKKDFRKALEVLKSYINRASDKDIEFWENFSDLAWMLQDYNAVKKASLKLIELGSGKLKDYIRLSFIYAFEDPRKAIDISLKGWRKFRHKFLLERIFYLAFSLKDWDRIIELSKEKSIRKIIFNETNLLIIYLIALQKTGKIYESLKIMESYLSDKFSKDLLELYIYSLVEIGDFITLKKILKMYKYYETDPKLATAFVVAYISLQEGKKAFYIYKKGKVNDIVLYSNILDLLGKDHLAKKYRFREFKNLDLKLRKNPNLINDPEFLRAYLSLGIYTLSPVKFEKLIAKAKNVLSPSVWKDIYLSYLLFHDKKEKVLRLAKFYKYPLKPWMWFNLAFWQNDKYLMERLINKYSGVLPIKDQVEVLSTLGLYGKTFTLAFKGLEENPYDVALHRQYRDLVLKTKDDVSTEAYFISREGFSGLGLDFRLRFNFLRKKLYVGVEAGYLKTISSNYLKERVNTSKLYLFTQRKFKKSMISFHIGVIDRVKPRISAYFKSNFRLNKKLNFSLDLGKNSETNETLYLYIGGMKDFLKVDLSLDVLKRLRYILRSEFANFYATDNTYLGYGIYLASELHYKLKYRYPDYTLKAYIQYGTYKEKENKGIISDVFLFKDFKVLPKDFLCFGIVFLFGYNDRDFIYSWKPFISVDVGYNKGLLVNLSGGIMKSISYRDYLSFEADISRNPYGVKETFFIIKTSYRRLF